MEKKGNFLEISKNYKISSEEINIDSKKDNLRLISDKKVIIQGEENGVFHKNYNSNLNKEKNKEKSAFYETDGHYSTVYLVCLMLGMPEDKAEELAIATENPDTDVHSETDFQLDETWGYPGSQKEIHSLTGGFHGIEELLTALKFIYLKSIGNEQETINKLGELLHRFGDTYAHTKFDNIKPSDLAKYDLANKPENVEKAIESWKGKAGKELSKDIEPWIKFINYNVTKYGYSFLTNETYQRESMNGRTLKQYLLIIYLQNPEDKYIMYGTRLGFFTREHLITDAGYPDLIYMRPEWYLCYVKNLAWIISVRFKLEHNKLNIKLFEHMVEFAKNNKCSMKGIIDFEIAKIRKKQEVYIPVFYSRMDRILASADAIVNTDYLANAYAVVENTKKYIKENNMIILNDGKEVHHGNIKIHKKPNGNFYEFEKYDEDYFIIKFK
ncbi:hypothetical protein A0O34_04845 [Chryseobacterium glaciei]|uniref:Uncharacterized protein n=1 Tax=Chryseobacterium glaciei TaxID=1685010 RepID=A0A172XSK0_9FLAO|nr:hypothetical protein [Chryseobacterium glaciei]ANF49896.1 hypothetical protein A0O34_04845 [Chryseobacterium glaciei]